MAAMKSLARLLLPAVLVLLAGCVSGTPSGPGPSRSRCPGDGAPGEPRAARPLVFLFCVESP
jgi:hypothetical protein